MSQQPAQKPQEKSLFARLMAFAPLAVFVALGALFAFGMFGQRVDRHASPLVGQPAPEAVLPALDGSTFDLAAYRGRPVILNVFASWCAPCRLEHPQLIQMSRDPRFVVIGLAYRDDPADTTAFLEELGNPFAAVAIDRQGAAAVRFGLTGVPETYVIDANGIVIRKFTGEITPRDAVELTRLAAGAGS